MKTISEQFNDTATKFAKRTALKFRFQETFIDVSFFELQRRVNLMAKALKSLGVRKGDRVAILSENRTEWVRTDLATLTLGAISVPIHTTVSPTIIKHIINDSGAKVLLVSKQEYFNKLVSIFDDLEKLEILVYIDLDHKEDLPKNKKVFALEELMKLGEGDITLDEKVELDDVASIVYTSGTTALPKGVMLTHRNFMFDAAASCTAVPITEKDVFLSFLPLSHVLERTGGYYAPLVVTGSTIAYAQNMQTLKADLHKVKPTVLVSVPRIFEKVHTGIWDKVKDGGEKKRKIFVWALRQEPGSFKYKIADILVFKKIRHAFGGRLRLAISGGASLNHKLARFFSRIGITIVEGYGLTETAPVITVNRPDNIKFGTVGQHLPGIEVKIAPDKEIITRGPNLMKGYYNNEELTKTVIDEDGWFHTGDLGFVNSEGFLVIVGRKKEMISLSNGKIAWPEQIELTLNNDRFISQSMVYGDRKSYLTALVIPDWQEIQRNISELGLESKEPVEFIKDEKLIKIFADRIEKINEQFADWEKIRKFKVLPKDFSADRDEVTPTLKLRRKKIEENYKQDLESFYQG